MYVEQQWQVKAEYKMKKWRLKDMIKYIGQEGFINPILSEVEPGRNIGLRGLIGGVGYPPNKIF